MKFTYDPVADAAFLYLVESIGSGEVKSSQLVPVEMKGASVIVCLDAAGRALGVEFLGARKQLSPALLDAILAETERPDLP